MYLSTESRSLPDPHPSAMLVSQDLVDCCTLNDGCDGGTMEKAFECVKEANGIDTESHYPYTAGVGAIT